MKVNFSLLCIVFFAWLVIFQCNSIQQTCDSSTSVSQNNLCSPPENTLCLGNGLCGCRQEYFGNCQYRGHILNLQTMELFNITQQTQYFIIEPTFKQEKNQIAFKIMITTNQTAMNKILIRFWIDDDRLDQLTSHNALDDEESQMKLKNGSNRYITESYKFRNKHTCQKGRFIIGISTSSSNNIQSLPIRIQYSQIQQDQDQQQQFITVIIVVFALVVIGVLIQCFYFKKKHIMKNTEQKDQNIQEMQNVFIQKQDQTNNTQFKQKEKQNLRRERMNLIEQTPLT